MVADPAAVGALRLDVTSPDPAYRQRLRAAFYGDLDPALADAAIALLTPDAPAGISLGTTTLTARQLGLSAPHLRGLHPGQDHPQALQQRFIADADAAFPANPTTVHVLHASHSPFLSMPGQVANIVLKLRR